MNPVDPEFKFPEEGLDSSVFSVVDRDFAEGVNKVRVYGSTIVAGGPVARGRDHAVEIVQQGRVRRVLEHTLDFG